MSFMGAPTSAYNAVLERARSRMSVIAYESRFEAEVLARAREMHAESIFHRDFPLNEKKLIEQLNAPRTLPHVYFKICVRGDEVMGGFFGIVSSMYFSDARVAKDLAWFVQRNARGSAAAVALLADFEEWAREQKVDHILIGQSTGVQMDETKALYERLGYTTLGVNTFKRI